MSAGYPLQAWRDVAEDAEDRLQRRLGVDRPTARKRLASKLRWAPGTLYNLARERLKGLDRDLREQLAAYAAEDLETEIAALTAKLEAIRQLRGSEDPKLACKVEAVLASAQRLHAAMTGGIASGAPDV